MPWLAGEARKAFGGFPPDAALAVHQLMRRALADTEANRKLSRAYTLREGVFGDRVLRCLSHALSSHIRNKCQ